MMQQQQKGESSRAQSQSPELSGKSDQSNPLGPSSLVPSAQGALDVDAATFQLAEAKIDEGGESAAAQQPAQSGFGAHRIPTSASREMEVSAPMSSLPHASSEMTLGLPIPLQSDESKTAQKQRADDIDKVLNSAGGATHLPSPYMISSASNQHFDNFRLGMSRIPSSMSGSFSFHTKNGGHFASRENSIEFRRGQFLGKRDRSVDMMRRDNSLDLMCPRKPGSHELGHESELPRDMSSEFFGNSLQGAGRDFSMEMQFPQVPQGAKLEMGALTDDVPLGFVGSGQQATREEFAKGYASYGPNADSRLHHSKIGMSQDDLMVHMYGNQQIAQPLYRRAINGSIEDFRELRHPF